MKKQKAASSSQKRAPVIRLTELTNPKTKKTVYARVASDGRLGKRDAEHLGIKKVTAWLEVEAKTWADATKAARAGRGRKVRASSEKRGSAPLAKAA